MASILLPPYLMRRKTSGASAGSPPREELQQELERCGLAPEHAGALADQLERLAGVLPASEYRALLDGVRLGQRARRSLPTAELQRLLGDFASELQKLDEGVRLLTSILVRLRDQTAHEPRGTLH